MSTKLIQSEKLAVGVKSKVHFPKQGIKARIIIILC